MTQGIVIVKYYLGIFLIWLLILIFLTSDVDEQNEQQSDSDDEDEPDPSSEIDEAILMENEPVDPESTSLNDTDHHLSRSTSPT